MDAVFELPLAQWDEPVGAALQSDAIAALEGGKLLFFPRLAFPFAGAEARFLSPSWSDGKSKNISLNEAGRLAGAEGTPADLSELSGILSRFRVDATTLIHHLFPRYVPFLESARTSFRPFEVETRASSYKKDDTRLHVDAFPSRPTHGTRILRVFANVHPEGKPRVWRVGEPFPDLARRFLPRLRRQWPGEARILAALGITKSRRTAYDHIMLELHDRMKADLEYQRGAPQITMSLPAGCAWVVFSDQVLHAAMSGQFMMEQTFHLPQDALLHPETAPLRVLERMAARDLSG